MEQSYRYKYHQEKLKCLEKGPVLDLSVINPDLPVEQEITDKLLENILQTDSHRYTTAQGVNDYLKAIANKYKNKFNIELDPSTQICAARGTQDALLSILNALGRKGDSVLIPRPFYSMHLEAISRSGMKPIFFDLNPDLDKLSKNILSALNKHKETRFLLLNFPNNPTGILVDQAFYANLFSQIVSFDLITINDFAYGELNYDDNPAVSSLSCLNADTKVIETFSLSKSYNLAGWRIAALLGSQAVTEKIISYKNQIDYGSFIPFQVTAAHVLNSMRDLSHNNRNIYKERADYLHDKLLNLGFKIETPSAGCCLWVELPSSIKKSSFDYCITLLNEHRIALQPGEIFGIEDSRKIRISLTANNEQFDKLCSVLS